MASTRHDPNQELIGQGLANIAAPLFGGFAATGAIARTATNVRNGGNSPLAGVVHVVTLVLVILFFAPYAVNIPLAALAAILFVVAWNMCEARHFIKMIKRAPRADVVILLVTFALTVFVDLVVAVNIGVILATLHFLRRMADSVEVQELTGEDLQHELVRHGIAKVPKGVLVYVIEGPIFFGAVETFERALAATHTDPKVLILRLGRVPFVDISALRTLEEVIVGLGKRNIRVILCEANERVTGKMLKAGIVDLIGSNNVRNVFAEALEVAAPMVDSAGEQR